MVVDSALKTQGRVIYALMMREVHTIHGNSRLGYLWTLINTMWGIFVFWGLRYAIGAGAPHGMSSLLFLTTGFGIYSIFSRTVSKCMTAVSGNKALLTFPQVTPVDIMVARTIIVWTTEIVCATIIIAGGYFLGIPFYISDFGSLIFILLIVPIFGLGVGLFCSSIAVFFPTLEKIVPMVMRLLMFASAVFYAATVIPSHILKYLWYNPLIQYVEWSRVCLSQGYTTLPPNVLYLVSVTAVCLCLGLLFERHVRGRVQ